MYALPVTIRVHKFCCSICSVWWGTRRQLGVKGLCVDSAVLPLTSETVCGREDSCFRKGGIDSVKDDANISRT